MSNEEPIQTIDVQAPQLPPVLQGIEQPNPGEARSLAEVLMDERPQNLRDVIAAAHARNQADLEEQARIRAAAQPVVEDDDDEPIEDDEEDEPIPTPPTTHEPPQTPVAEEMNEEYRTAPRGFPAPEPGELIMTRLQLGRCRKPDIKEKFIRVASMRATDPPEFGWWAGFGLGYAIGRSSAARFNYTEIMSLSTEMVDTYLYVDYGAATPVAAEAKPDEPRRKCSWLTMLGQQLIQMIAVAPKNATFRARVMAVMKEPIPDECVTPDQIRDWIEFNFPRDPKGRNTSLDLNFKMTYTHIESGMCAYRRRVHGDYTGKLTKAQLVEIVRDNPDMDMDELMVVIREKCEEIARDNGNESYEDLDHSNHAHSDESDHDCDIQTSLRGPVTSILKEALTEDECNELGI